MKLVRPARQFIICEAKLFSKLTPGTTRAPEYDQAARNVGCLCEILRQAKDDHKVIQNPNDLEVLGFYVIAPVSRIKEGVFDKQMEGSGIFRKIRERAAPYEGEKGNWLRDWVEPVVERLSLECLSWEQIFEQIGSVDPDTEEKFCEFYRSCLRYNNQKSQEKS